MPIIRTIAHKVFRCFWRIERCADRLTGKVGPVFVTIALVLMGMAIITYFEVIYPLAFLTPHSDPFISSISFIFSVYLASCSIIHYYFACTTPPGSPSEPINQTKPSGIFRFSCPKKLRRWLPRSPRIGKIKQEMIEQYRTSINRHCQKCLKNGIKGIDSRGPIKPQRAHHCRVCGICQLKYDHHCPWINQCVGLRNERFFLLFLFYMTVSCGWVVFWGWPAFSKSLNFDANWPFRSPRVFVLLTWVLALAIGVTLGIMFGWQFLLIARGETTVESSDNEYYRKLLSQRGQNYLNPFDLGLRKNLELFFNIGPGGKSRWYTIFLPIKISPGSDGWSWPQRPGWENQIISSSEELTDEEEDDEVLRDQNHI